MASIKAKRSVHLKQDTTRNNHVVTTGHPDRSGSSAERRNQIRSTSKAARRNDRRVPTLHSEQGKLAERRTSTRSTLSRRTQRSKPTTKWLRRILRFPQARGKAVESVEFSTELGYHCITINFTDKTSLNFEIEARFIVETDYSDWKTGNQRILRAWRPVRNLEFRDTIKKA